MIERLYSVETIQKGEAGDLMVMLRDNKSDNVLVIMLPSDDFGKLAAFPGSVVKMTLEKV